MEALSLAMKSKQSFHVREKKISSELSFNDSSNKTINHDENSSFVEVPASSTVISPETLTPLTVNKIPEVPNKPLPFQPIKLSDSFLKHGISAFVNFKFNIDAFLL